MSLYERVSTGKDLGRWRAGSFLADRVIERQLEGRTLDLRDVDTLLLGPGMLRDEKGAPLLVYLPGVLKKVIRETGVYDVLHPLKSKMTNNRGMASGTKRLKRGGEDNEGARSDTLPISSVMLGAADPGGVYRYCRMTEWTGSNVPEWEKLTPFFQVIAGHFAEQVPDRYSAQMEVVRKSDPAWIVPGTPFTTITVNNSYSTGVHKDVGDLDTGFSCLAVLRRGEYEGGLTVFPRYRAGVDLRDGDLLLMNAHQWHGNTRMICACGEQIMNKACEVCGAERISVVCYYRTKIAECGTPEQEYERAVVNTEKRSQPRKKTEPEPQVDPVMDNAAAPALAVPEPEPEPKAEQQTVPEQPPAPKVRVSRKSVPRKAAPVPETDPVHVITDAELVSVSLDEQSLFPGQAPQPMLFTAHGPVPFRTEVTEMVKPARKRAVREPETAKTEAPAKAGVRTRRKPVTVKTGGADSGEKPPAGDNAAGRADAAAARAGRPSWEDL